MKEFTKISLHNHIGGKDADKKIDEAYDKEITINYQEAFDEIERAYSEGFKLLAITNSNNINIELVYILQYYCKLKGYDIKLLPGAELNLFNDGKILHICMILDDLNSNVYKVQKTLEGFVRENMKNRIDYDQLLELIVNDEYKIKAILSPHGLKQGDKSITANAEHIDELRVMDNEIIPILIEDNQKYNRQTLMYKLKDELSEENYQWLSDAGDVSAIDRKNYSINPTYVWSDNTFNGLFYSSIMKKTRFFRSSDLSEKVNYISKFEIEFEGDAQEPIELSHGLNAIVGDSGSGKTLLLNWMYKSLSGNNIESTPSSFENQYDEIYSKGKLTVYDKYNEKIKIDDIKAFHGDNLYNKIITLLRDDRNDIVKMLGGEISATQFVKEINDLNRFTDNLIKVKTRIRRLNKNITEDLKSFNSLQKQLSDIKISNLNIKSIEEANLQSDINKQKIKLNGLKKTGGEVNEIFDQLTNISKTHRIPIIKILDFLKTKIQLSLRKEYYSIKTALVKNEIQIEKIKMINVHINSYNGIIGKNNARVNELRKHLETVELSIKEESLKLYKLKKEESYIKSTFKNVNLNSLTIESSDAIELKYLSTNTLFEIEKFDELFEKGFSRRVNKSKANLTPTILKASNINEIDITSLESIDSICEILINEYYGKIEENYIKLEFNNSYEQYLDIMVQIRDTNTNDFVDINTLSAGQLGKYYIESMLSSEIEAASVEKKLVIFFDQPDNSIGKKFILESLVKKLSELKLEYQIIITTHEPLLVINADANCIIRATNEKTISEDNKFKYEKINISSDVNSKSKLIETISEIIDGSHDAVKHRNNVYEGMNYGNTI